MHNPWHIDDAVANQARKDLEEHRVDARPQEFYHSVYAFVDQIDRQVMGQLAPGEELLPINWIDFRGNADALKADISDCIEDTFGEDGEVSNLRAEINALIDAFAAKRTACDIVMA